MDSDVNVLELIVEEVTPLWVMRGEDTKDNTLKVRVQVSPRGVEGGDGRWAVYCGATGFYFQVNDPQAAQAILDRWYRWCTGELSEKPRWQVQLP